MIRMRTEIPCTRGMPITVYPCAENCWRFVRMVHTGTFPLSWPMVFELSTFAGLPLALFSFREKRVMVEQFAQS